MAWARLAALGVGDRHYPGLKFGDLVNVQNCLAH
jgi:hypothetical protein